MTNLYDQLIGLPWYRPERYDEARSRMADSALLPESYDIWREGAEQREHDTHSSGATPLRVYVDDDGFVTFCAEKNLILDSKARMRYAAHKCLSFKSNVADYEHPDFWPGAIRRK